jgi:hypothetical protein
MKLKALGKYSILFLLLPVIITSCKKTSTLVQGNVAIQMPMVTFTIQANQTSTDTTISVYYNVDSAIRKSNASFNITNIKSVTATAVNSALTGPTDAIDNFGNVSSLAVSITSTSDNTNAVFAQVTNNPNSYATVLSIPANNNVVLKNYFDASSFNFTFNGTLSTATTIPLQAQAIIQFNIVVGPN